MRLVGEERSSGAWLFYVGMVLVFLFFLVARELRFPDDRIWPWSLVLGAVHVLMAVLGLVRFVAARRRENRVTDKDA